MRNQWWLFTPVRSLSKQLKVPSICICTLLALFAPVRTVPIERNVLLQNLHRTRLSLAVQEMEYWRNLNPIKTYIWTLQWFTLQRNRVFPLLLFRSSRIVYSLEATYYQAVQNISQSKQAALQNLQNCRAIKICELQRGTVVTTSCMYKNSSLSRENSILGFVPAKMITALVQLRQSIRLELKSSFRTCGLSHNKCLLACTKALHSSVGASKDPDMKALVVRKQSK